MLSMFRLSLPSSAADSSERGGDEVEWFNRSFRRARLDYDQMPGLSLTPQQAARLWNVPPDVSQRVLSSLVDVGYVKTSPSGYVRTSVGLTFFSRRIN